jgi:hypothetical protein
MLLRSFAEYFRIFQLSRISRTRGRGAATLGLVAACVTLTGCATRAPLAILPPESYSASSSSGADGIGELVVYTATFAATLEEGEYPAHTDYIVGTASDRLIEHVTNRTGSFDKRPATVNLASGEYHVRAQYDRGGFVIIPVAVRAGTTTTIHLDGLLMPAGTPADPIRLPNGSPVGWCTVSSR